MVSVDFNLGWKEYDNILNNEILSHYILVDLHGNVITHSQIGPAYINIYEVSRAEFNVHRNGSISKTVNLCDDENSPVYSDCANFKKDVVPKLKENNID